MARVMTASAALALMAACAEPSEPQRLSRNGVVQGPIETTATGDAWVFLYAPGEGPPGAPAEPRQVTAVSAQQLSAQARYVMADVAPEHYRLFGLIDVDSNFDPSIDVLSQPTAGDRVSAPIDFQAQPGRGAEIPLKISTLVLTQPPAFVLEGVMGGELVLDASLNALTPLTLVADPVGRFDPNTVGLSIGLVDADGDARPDDVDGDGTPDLSLRVFLRWRPRPGVLHDGTSVLVALAFDPSPFVVALQGRLGVSLTVDRIQAVLIPQAQLVTPLSDGGVDVQSFGAPPAGDYELVALAAGGQFWRIPNQLPLDSQQVHLHLDRLAP